MSEFLNVLALIVRIHNLVDMLRIKYVLCLFFAEFLAGVDEQNASVCIRFFQDNDTCRDSCAKEDSCRKADDSVYAAVFYEMFSDCAFAGATEQYAVRQDNAHSSAVLQMIEAMKQEGKICL